MRWLIKIIDRLCVVAGALFCSQAPLFMQYYSQQLAGRVAELQTQIKAMTLIATQTGKNLSSYILKFLNSQDEDFRLQGELMKEMVTRANHLTEGLQALQEATVWQKPLAFLQFFSWDVAQTTWDTYKVGIPLTAEGFIYALLGTLLGFLLFTLLKRIAFLISLPFRRQKPIVILPSKEPVKHSLEDKI